MKKISKNLKKLYWLLACSPVFLFGAGGSFASVLNTIVLVIGILWIIVLMLGALFNVQAIQNHVKFVIIASIVLGVTYGLTAAAM